MSFSKYTPGALALGFVLQVSDSHVIISLPGGLTGTVELQEISDIAHRIVTTAAQQQSTQIKKLKAEKVKKIQYTLPHHTANHSPSRKHGFTNLNLIKSQSLSLISDR